MSKGLDAALRGALAGGLATLPMSALMLGAGKAGLMGEQPPKTIVETLLGWAGLPVPEKKVEEPIIAAAHIGYGMLAGALFGLCHRRARHRIAAPLQGVGYALLIWALSYEGWIPALHIMRPAERDRPGRPQSMVAAHVVYGSVLGALVR